MKVVDLRGQLPIHPAQRYGTRTLADIRSIAIHHSLTASGSAAAFARYHVEHNGWPGIGYTYVIDTDGTVNQCWNHNVITYHVGNSNKQALGICLVGDFRTNEPTSVQYEAALHLVRQLQTEIPSATSIYGHSEYPGYSWKACPVINMDLFRAAIANTVDTFKEEIRMELKPWQWSMLGNALDGLYQRSVSGEISPPVITDYGWAEKAYKGTLTLGELTWLNMIVTARSAGISLD